MLGNGNFIVSAFSKTINWISNILSPFIIISVLTDIKDLIGFIGQHIRLSIAILALIIAVFMWNIIAILKSRKSSKAKFPYRSQNKENEIATPSLLETRSKYSKTGLKKNRLGIKTVYLSLFLMLLSIGSILYLANLANKTLYYPIIESIAKNEKSNEYVKSINKILQQKKDIRLKEVKSYCSNGFCAIVPNGVHFSKKDANESILVAKLLIPQYVDDSTWVDAKSIGNSIFGRIK